MRKVGILGGTFNPIHIGHLLLAQWALDEFKLDEILFIPAGIPYMKEESGILPGRERMNMVEMAIAGHDRFRCSDIEIRRNGYTYTYETLEQLKEENQEDELFFIMGADCLFKIDKWKYPEKIFRNAILICALRDGFSMDEIEKQRAQILRKNPEAKILLLPYFHFSLSSTIIRDRINSKKSIRYLVPEAVQDYIENRGLYIEKSR